MSQFLGFLQYLELVIYLIGLRIIFPANVSLFFEQLVSVIQFDILPPDQSTARILAFDLEGMDNLSEDIFF